MHLVTQLATLLSNRERWQLSALLLLLTVRAAVEMVGVASIMPFMSMVAEPAVIHRQAQLSAVFAFFEFRSDTAFLTVFGVAVILLLAVSNSVGALAQYGLLRFSWGMHHRLSMRLLKGYLVRPYAFFTQRNSASLNKTLLSEVQTVVNGVLTPALDIAARMLMVVAMLVLLVVIDPLLAAIIGVVLGGAYGLVYFLIKRKQRRLGQKRVEANRLRFKISGEAFGGIKDVKILGRESAFLAQFKSASWTFSQVTASNAAISQLPRYVLETIAFGGIVLIVLYLLQIGSGVVEILPVVSLYAFAGYRLMPELQKLFANAAGIRFNRAALDDLLKDYHHVGELPKPPAEQLSFMECMEFSDISFSYPGVVSPTLDGLSLRIQRNQTVGIVGSSGAGKTTIVDLLLGLYEPDTGSIRVDGIPLAPARMPAWRQQIGYVPQHIFLTDDTIAANIAFGVPPSAIDAARVERAARIAHLHEFIVALPAAYGTFVGERGVRLSGGQRQRIGIARALYHDPAILVMDEATSALDGATESAVMEAIQELGGRKTIVLVAHRLTTVRDCDVVFLIENGQLRDSGDFTSLLNRNPLLRSMSGLEQSDNGKRVPVRLASVSKVPRS